MNEGINYEHFDPTYKLFFTTAMIFKIIQCFLRSISGTSNGRKKAVSGTATDQIVCGIFYKIFFKYHTKSAFLLQFYLKASHEVF